MTMYEQLEEAKRPTPGSGFFVNPEIKNEPSRAMTATFITSLGAAALFALIAASPAIESAQDVIVYDAVITRTCYERHGLNFLGRWSCRTSLHRVGPMALLMPCAFGNKDKKNDICAMADKVTAENDKNKTESKP